MHRNLKRRLDELEGKETDVILEFDTHVGRIRAPLSVWKSIVDGTYVDSAGDVSVHCSTTGQTPK